MHFAEIDLLSNIVKRVIVAETKEWCETSLGGVWKRTYYNTPGKTYAGVGYEYIEDAQNFRPPHPFPSWTFEYDAWEWRAPIPYPADDDGKPRHWNEETQTWVVTV